MSRITLRQQITRKLTRLLGGYLLGVTGVIVLVAVVSISLFNRQQLEQYQALVSTKLSAELTALIREADSVGNSSVVWTGLTDSAGREAYLEPLLARINRNSVHRIDLLDYRGRDYILSQKAGRQARLSPQAIERTMEEGRLQAELAGQGQQHQLLFSLPIVAPFVDTPVGMLMVAVQLEPLLASLGLPPAMKVDFALQREQLPPIEWGWFGSSAVVPVTLGPHTVPLVIQLQQTLWDRLGVLALVVLLLLGSGYLFFTRVRVWADGFAKGLSRRLETLVQVTSRLASQGDAQVGHDTVGDEISSVFESVQGIVLRQRAINQQLLVSSRVFETAAEAILITDSHGRIADVNAALLRMTGYQREDILGQPAGLLYRMQDTVQDGPNIAEAVNVRGEWRGETWFMTRERQPIPVLLSVSALRDDQQQSLGNVAIFSDISAVKQAEAKLRELSYQDSLTGLPNYRAFTEFMENRLRQTPADGAVPRFALLFIDLDHLKHINDSYGHEQGDQVIVQIAQCLQTHLPEPHFVCRRSGDEFIAVLDIDDSPEGLAQRLRTSMTTVTHRIQLPGDQISHASFSVGAVVYPDHARTLKDLLVMADSALLFAKEAGRARVTWLTPELIGVIQRRHRIEAKLHAAVRDRLILPHYQPEVDMRDGRITGFEALARWEDADMGFISPAEFIPIAEDQGLIDEISAIMLEKILHDLPAIRARFADAAVAFNASPKLLTDHKIHRLLQSHLQPGQADHRGLVMEVTESHLVRSIEEANLQLESVIALGVQIAIDDFGKGYSSLARLSQMPIHKLKIDSAFVSALADSSDTKIVASILALARTLSLDVTAEGVETPVQRELLLGVGCHKAQGFLFARPMALAQVLALPLNVPLPAKS